MPKSAHHKTRSDFHADVGLGQVLVTLSAVTQTHCSVYPFVIMEKENNESTAISRHKKLTSVHRHKSKWLMGRLNSTGLGFSFPLGTGKSQCHTEHKVHLDQGCPSDRVCAQCLSLTEQCFSWSGNEDLSEMSSLQWTRVAEAVKKMATLIL